MKPFLKAYLKFEAALLAELSLYLKKHGNRVIFYDTKHINGPIDVISSVLTDLLGLPKTVNEDDSVFFIVGVEMETSGIQALLFSVDAKHDSVRRGRHSLLDILDKQGCRVLAEIMDQVNELDNGN